MSAPVDSPEPPDSALAAGPPVVALDDPAARDPALTGGKASSLARAAHAGLPTPEGFAITTAAVAAVDADPGGDLAELLGDDVDAAWRELSSDGIRALAVRSSSTAEDLAASSMAGRFESVIGVVGRPAFLDAVREVLASRTAAAEGDDDLAPDHPMAVLVQPVVEATAGGVAFGVDPVTGRSDRVVVVVASGGPQPVVAGEVAGTRYELDHNADVQEIEHGRGGARLDSRHRHDIVALVERAAAVFGGPQDVEWAIDQRHDLVLLQSRPVTTPVVGTPSGPVFSPGPVAETFPTPLSRLEQDLWVRPLRHALREVLTLTGTSTPDALAATPLVVAPGGRVAVDVEAFGLTHERGGWARFDPRPRVRRLRAAWRVGRLRAALPDLARDLVGHTDDELLQVPAVERLTDRQLLDLLGRTARALTAVHGHEMLIGLLVQPDAPALTGVSVALRALVDARRQGLDDDEIVARHPVVLALVPPRVQPYPPLPPEASAPPADPQVGDEAATAREALRLRARWLQELSGRAAWALGERLAGRGALPAPELVRHLRLTSLDALVRGRAVLWHVGEDQSVDEPLPARFQLTGAGEVVAVERHGTGQGTGAGGGVGEGPVTHDPGESPRGSVLVVASLETRLAPAIGRLGGLVAETGSPLAHIAILAREAGVPIVVGAVGARERFAPGQRVRVDGSTGEVTEVADGGSAA